MLGEPEGNALCVGTAEGLRLGALELGLSEGSSLGAEDGESEATLLGLSLGEGEGTSLR